MNPALTGTVIHRTEDTLGRILVIDQRKHRVLTFDSVFEQSKIERARPGQPVHEYARAMLLPVAFFTPARVTILGLGAGTLASALHRLSPDTGIHAVELRQKVVDIAHEYFGLPRSGRLRITVADARRTLAELPPSSTDLILTDLYDAQRMSPAQNQVRFIDQCAEALSSSGWLVLNYHQAPPQNGPLFLYLRAVFAVVLLFRAKSGNHVIYACKEPFEPLSRKDPRLEQLEDRLPLDWPRLMGKVVRIA